MHTLQAAYLSLCPVTSHKQAAMGLFLASLLAQDMVAVKRVAPEPLCFAVQVLQRMTPADVHDALVGGDGDGDDGDALLLDVAAVVASPADDAYFASRGFCRAALAVAVRVVRACADACGDVAAAPELFADALGALEQLQGNAHCSDAVRCHVAFLSGGGVIV